MDRSLAMRKGKNSGGTQSKVKDRMGQWVFVWSDSWEETAWMRAYL